MVTQKAKFLFVTIISLLAVACSGGGGGDDGSTDQLKRETKTALRVVHAALDVAPIEVYAGLQMAASARFGQQTYYSRLEDSSVKQLVVARANTAGSDVVKNIPITYADDTEYTLFVYGKAEDSSLKYNLMIDNIERPEETTCLVRLFNALPDSGNLTISGTDFTVAGVSYGEVSAFGHGACLAQTFRIMSADGAVAQVAVDLPERSEATIVITGDRDLGFTKLTTYLDLD